MASALWCFYMKVGISNNKKNMRTVNNHELEQSKHINSFPKECLAQVLSAEPDPYDFISTNIRATGTWQWLSDDCRHMKHTKDGSQLAA